MGTTHKAINIAETITVPISIFVNFLMNENKLEKREDLNPSARSEKDLQAKKWISPKILERKNDVGLAVPDRHTQRNC